MIILSEPNKLPNIDFIVRSEMPQHYLEHWYVRMLHTRIQGRLGHLLAQMLIVQEQRQDLSILRLLLDHLSDGPAGALGCEFAAELEIQVDEGVELVVNHCINYWCQSI